jgi:transcriptional regulator with XRE-family HTH domain
MDKKRFLGKNFFGDRIRTDRKARKMSQKQLAELVGVRYQTILRAEKNIMASMDLLKRIADSYEEPVIKYLNLEVGDDSE